VGKIGKNAVRLPVHSSRHQIDQSTTAIAQIFWILSFSTTCGILELWPLCQVHCSSSPSPLQEDQIFTKIDQEEGKIVQAQGDPFHCLGKQPISADRVGATV
jgi:hypothetical protein